MQYSAARRCCISQHASPRLIRRHRHPSWPLVNGHESRSPGSRGPISHAFPVAQWHTAGNDSLTVAGQHRTFTCFPFHADYCLPRTLCHFHLCLAKYTPFRFCCQRQARPLICLLCQHGLDFSGSALQPLRCCGDLRANAPNADLDLARLTLQSFLL